MDSEIGRAQNMQSARYQIFKSLAETVKTYRQNTIFKSLFWNVLLHQLSASTQDSFFLPPPQRLLPFFPLL